MKHHFLAAIDWISVKLSAVSILLTVINPDNFIKALAALSSSITIGYNIYRWIMEARKNRKLKKDE